MKILLRRHMIFYIAAAGGVAAFLTSSLLARALAPVIAANCFFILYMLLALIILPHMTAAHLKKHAASTDEPVWLIFLVTIAAIIIAVIALFMLINQKPFPDALSLTVTLAAVPLGWLTIHMMSAIHYAHLFWQPDLSAGGLKTAERQPRGGLAFPGTAQPCGSDFVYFSYVIGMTAQTSDTNITTSAMRRVNVLHAIVSFFFNTVLVAAAVNVAVALGS